MAEAVKARPKGRKKTKARERKLPPTPCKEEAEDKKRLLHEEVKGKVKDEAIETDVAAPNISLNTQNLTIVSNEDLDFPPPPDLPPPPPSPPLYANIEESYAEIESDVGVYPEPDVQNIESGSEASISPLEARYLPVEDMMSTSVIEVTKTVEWQVSTSHESDSELNDVAQEEVGTWEQQQSVDGEETFVDAWESRDGEMTCVTEVDYVQEEESVQEEEVVKEELETEVKELHTELAPVESEEQATSSESQQPDTREISDNKEQNQKLPRLKVIHRKLYPTLEGLASPPVVGETLRPFTEEQLKSLYYNSELGALGEFTEEFMKHIIDDKHEFYELVLNYYRARNHLVNAEHDIDTLRAEAEKHLDRVWITREKTVLVQGKCADQAKVSVQHKFDQVVFSEEACNDLSRTLKSIRSHIHDEMSLHAYASQLSRLQVESYIHDFYMRSPGLCDLSKNLPARSWLPQEREPSLAPEVKGLKELISVLFMFQRKPAKDSVFTNDTRHWISRLVATLLRVATLEDHLWLLQHVLRCPAGVGSWAADLIQVAPPPISVGRPTFGSPLLDHCLSMLALLMLPIKGREDVLYQLKAAATPNQEPTVDHPWIIVDSDGEEDEDNAEGWHYLHENDLVKLFQQFPINDVFKHVLFIDRDQGGKLKYDICMTSESNLLKVFAFASCMIQVLSFGLKNFKLGRYRQFNKRIATAIKNVIGFISDHWENYKVMLSALSPSTEDRLQLEYDQVFYRATRAILSAQRLGSWQFMSDMPYKCVSMAMMWRLVWLMHQSYKDGTVDIDQYMTVDQCLAELDDDGLRQQFEERLLTMPTSEAIYLLTAFSKMAASRSQGEATFVEAITSEIYQIAYLSPHTREFCSKIGRDLLAGIASQHPFIISVILDHVKVTHDRIGMVALYLFRELPLTAWVPLERDYQLLRGWLLNEPLGSPVHQLACLIYANINWGINPKTGELMLSLGTHRQTAVLLVDVASKHLTNKHMASFITDSVRQVASVVRSSVPPEQTLCSWLWEVAFKLQLHGYQQPKPGATSPTSGFTLSFDAPNLSDDPRLHPILKAVKEKSALAAYLALVTTTYGHTTTDVCEEGVNLLSLLVEQGHYAAAVRALSLITPLFLQCPQYLTSSVKFIATLQLLVTADSLKRGLLSSDFPGPVTKLITAMTQYQIMQHRVTGGGGRSANVILFWLQLLAQLTRWHQDRHILYVLDHIIAAAFLTQQGRDVVSQFFNNITKHLMRGQREQGLVSSLVSWIATGYNQPSLMEGQSCSDAPYFAWSVLAAEREIEISSGLWSAVLRELFMSPSIQLEQALKRAAIQVKLDSVSSVQRLCIYRWAHQALDTPLGHPILPLLWQQFFLAYLGRLTQEDELPQRGSVGERFFESSTNNSMMKQMKKRLNEAADFHHKAAVATSTADTVDVAGKEKEHPYNQIDPEGVMSPTADASCSDGLVLVEGRQDFESRTFHENLVRLYQTMVCWLDEPRLHNPNLYLPALPSQYDAEKLLKLFNSDQNLWLEFLNSRDIEDRFGAMSGEWTSQTTTKVDPSLFCNGQMETPTSRILSRLQASTKPQDSPPLITPRPPVPEVHPSILSDKQAMLYALRSDLHSICDYARLFAQRVAKNVAIDCNYIDLMPSLYRNEPTEIVLSAMCTSTFNPAHRCKGPASLTVQYEAKKRAELVSRKVEENRVEYKQLMIESALPPAQNICSAVVHVENAISALIRQSQASIDSNKKSATLEVGASLFYYLATLISEETKFYPPTRQFFAACIEVLGQEFIRDHSSQSQPLMQAILQSPSLAGLLSPNFSPNASPQLYVTMYEDMIPVPINQGPEVAFTLLTKFDVEMWLARSKPSLSQRAALVQVIGSALCACGQEPDCTLAMVFEVYRTHLKLMLTHQFPDHYGDVLRLIFNGSKNGELSPKMWSDFLELLGCAVVPELEPPDPDNIELLDASPPDNKAVTPTSPPPKPLIVLSAKHMRETLEWLSSQYFTARVSSAEVASFGLYPRWKPYIPYVATFLGHLATQTIIQTSEVCRNGDISPQKAQVDLWKQIVDAYAPWIQPLDNNGQVLSPWLDTDIVMATTMVGMFVENIKTLRECFHDMTGSGRDVLGLLWPYYVDTLSLLGTPEHVLQVIHSQLRALPWSSFYPDAQAMALMLQLREHHSRSCFLFAGHIMTSVRWSDILERVGNHDALTRSHATLFQLLVYMAKEQDLLLNTRLPSVLREADGYNWSFLDSVSYTTAVDWFLDNCDPRCVVAERSSDTTTVLRLLRTAAGFVHDSNVALHIETPLKWVSYVRCYVKLMCRCSHLPEIPADNYAVLMTNLLTDVEAVIGTTTDPNSQHQEALTLCSEVLAALNNLNPASKCSQFVLTALLEWLRSSPTSILLLPLITAAGRTLASLAHMVQLVEASVDAHFVSGVGMDDACGWGWVLAAVQVPDLTREDFVNECVVHGSYLTLFAHVLQQLPLCQSPLNEFTLLRSLVSWTAAARPRQENEAKLILWWGKVLELTLRQISFKADHQMVLEVLLAFTPALGTLGEDKSSSGLWGAIGLGKKSPLSQRFRLLVRCLQAFLLAQMPNKASLRVSPFSPGSIRGDDATPPSSPSRRSSSSSSSSPRSPGPSPQAMAALAQLESLRTNKQYTAFVEHIDWAVCYISDPSHSLLDSPNMLVHLSTQLFPEYNYLGLFRPQLG